MKCDRTAGPAEERGPMKEISSDGVQIITPQGGHSGSRFITVPARAGDSIEQITERAMDAFKQTGGTIVAMDIMGLPLNQCMVPVESVTGPVIWPITWIAEANTPMTGGIQIWVETEAEVSPIHISNHLMGTRIETPDATLCRLSGLTGRIPTRSNHDQAVAALNQMDRALKAVDMDFEHTVRTWYYNCDIVAWYETFNHVRDHFFEDHQVYEGLIPASTGIGACNVAGSALTCGLLAMKPKHDGVHAQEVASPLQCPATDYGSSFSRAAEIVFPDHRQLFVSGTASIEPHGETIHRDDMEGQIHCTLEVVEAILESRNMGWDHVTRAVAYVKHLDDIQIFDAWREKGGLEDLPVLTMVAEVCRDDLLFEIEVDAIAGA